MVEAWVQGTDEAAYTITYTDGTRDEVDLHWSIDLRVTPTDLTQIGAFAVATHATFAAQFRIWGTAARLSDDGHILNGFSFDSPQAVNSLTPYPMATSFKVADGTLSALDLDLPASTAPYVYRLAFAPGTHESTIWTRLPSPFVYSADDEANPVTLLAQVHNVATSFTGTVLDAATSLPIPGASVQFRNIQLTTDVDGRFTVDTVSPGSLTIQITMPG